MKYKDIRLLMVALLMSTIITVLIESVIFTLMLTKRYAIPDAFLYALSIIGEMIILYSLLRLRSSNRFFKKAFYCQIIYLVILMIIRALNFFIPQYISMPSEHQKILLLPIQAANVIFIVLLYYNMFYGLAELAKKINLTRLTRLLKRCFALNIFFIIWYSCAILLIFLCLESVPTLYDAILSNNMLIWPIVIIFFILPSVFVWRYILSLIQYLYQQLNSANPRDIWRKNKLMYSIDMMVGYLEKRLK